MEANFGSYWDKFLIAELITLFCPETQWMYPARVCNLQFTTVFHVLSFSWVYFDRKCFVEKTREAALTATNNFLPEPFTSPSPTQSVTTPALPVTTTRLSVFYLAQSSRIATRTAPDPLKRRKMQRRLSTRTGSVLCAVISNMMCPTTMSAQSQCECSLRTTWRSSCTAALCAKWMRV